MIACWWRQCDGFCKPGVRLAAACALLWAATWSQRTRGEDAKVPAAAPAAGAAEKAKEAAEATATVVVTPQDVGSELMDELVLQQALAPYRPILQSELELIRQACDLPVEQRPRVKQAGEAALRKAVGNDKNPMQGVRFFGGQGESKETVVREQIRQALTQQLTPEQAAKYAARTEQRTAIRKRAAILFVVARLDGELSLDADQRDKISENLSTAWQKQWDQWPQLLHFNANFVPDLPEKCVVPVLNADQAAVYTGLQKINGHISVFMQRNDEAEPDDWWGSEPRPAAKAGPAAAGPAIAAPVEAGR